MPSVAVPEAFCVVTTATAKGVLTVSASDCLLLFPGANAWVSKDDGSATARVKILSRLSTTTILVRRYPNDSETTKNFTVLAPAPSYGTSDMSAFTGSIAHICQEAQTAPVDPSFSVRTVP